MTTRDKGITLPTTAAAVDAKGSFTLGATINTVVANVNATAASVILIIPTNAAAATLMGSVKSLYVSTKTAGVSFTVTTANGVAAAGTENFDYWIKF